MSDDLDKSPGDVKDTKSETNPEPVKPIKLDTEGLPDIPEFEDTIRMSSPYDPGPTAMEKTQSAIDRLIKELDETSED